jgi:catechol 2,3-dioxygenase
MPGSTKASVGASVNHLVLNVRDIEASHHFYTELLGFEQCAQLSHGAVMRFYRAIRRITTTSHWCRSRTASLPGPEAWSMEAKRVGLNHIAMAYPDRESFLKQLRHLRANGVEFIVRGNHGMTHSAYISDPDGYGIEVLYEVPAEVWSGDVDAALNYFEVLPPEEEFEDTTEYQRFGADVEPPVEVPGRIRVRQPSSS